MGVRTDVRLKHVRRSVHSCERDPGSRGTWLRTFVARQKLQGRAGAIRLRNWQDDITAPPKPQDTSSRAAYAETRYCLAGWLRKTLQDTPKRSAPHIMTDFSDRMGVTRIAEKSGCDKTPSHQKEKAWQPPSSGLQ